jgi:hypothetical protein
VEEIFTAERMAEKNYSEKTQSRNFSSAISLPFISAFSSYITRQDLPSPIEPVMRSNRDRNLDRSNVVQWIVLIPKALSPRRAALLETQLNFIHTCPCQTKDKIRLLIQKLEEKKQY